ncbi:MAG: SET domain-containing protein-lysine N-methyltransferase [Rhodospirillales bacterium]|nr:SET domain-containing protein-lysine N-methyltransferase [Rhodospirillales bacterium]MCW8953017.1 SET domain-containing protein-lysine N-methyltransferase [Rhodospirillales bacterium]MCW9002427.1 SET domain-containing protein-lysine N-methyltransferase [Rhodospirillales bacterium]
MRLVPRSRRSVLPQQEDQADSLLYPADFPYAELMPRHSQFEVFSEGAIGRGVRARVDFERGTVMAQFAGHMTSVIMQHTLQVTPTSHVHDPYFIGLLTHSCGPNTFLDMARLEVLALEDISAGTILTVDYATTEDVLFRQFPCHCGSSNCRRWVTGRRERVNAEGRDYLARLQQKT